MVYSFIEFLHRWNKKTALIKKQTFDKDQCYSIFTDFLSEVNQFELLRISSGKKKEYTLLDIEQIKNDVDISLEIAYSNFRRENRGFWAKIFGGKKELNLLKVK